MPEDDCQQIDTSAIKVKHTSRVRGADQWTGPGNDLAAGSAATPRTQNGSTASGWPSKTDLGKRIVRAWSIVPAAVNEREVAVDLLKRRKENSWRKKDTKARN